MIKIHIYIRVDLYQKKTYCIFFMGRGDGGTAYRVPFVGTPFFSLCHSLLSLYLCNVQLDIGQFCNCMSLASPRKNGETLFAFLVSSSVRTVSMGQCVRPHVDLTVIDNFSLCSSFCLFFSLKQFGAYLWTNCL